MDALIYILSGIAYAYIGVFIIIAIGVLIYGLSVLGESIGRNIARFTKDNK